MNKNVLITGITGFAGSHLAELLVKEGYTVSGTHVSDRNITNLDSVKDSITLYKVNLLDAEETSRIIGEIQPEIVFHLAASTQPAESFKKPAAFLTNNISSEVNVLEALRHHNLTEAKIIIIASAHVYGIVKPEDIPITETTPFRPDNPYSVSKIAQDYLAYSYYLAYNQHIIRLRPSNHIGPRQSAEISISRWAKRVAEIEKGLEEAVLHVGNLTTKRDFTDVRDMVRAYLLASLHCSDGEAYNIGTGIAPSMQEMLDKLISLASVKITVETDQSLFRPSDIPEIRVNPEKFVQATGWKPEISLEKTLQDTLDYWRKVV